MKLLATAMPVLALTCVCTHARADSFGMGANQFEIEFVEIGDPGNAADTTGTPNPAGSVDYVYRIGKFEVSRDIVEKANAEGGLGITLSALSSVIGGPRPEMPAGGVSWNEAARFVNWLNSSQGFPAAYKFTAQPGDSGYDVNASIELWAEGDAGFDAKNPFRNSQAQYFLPSANEWYKAAYYDPATGRYWNYPTGSDAPPTAVAGGADPNTAVYEQDFEQGPADVTQAGGLSPYGVMGLGGNVWEWEETTQNLLNDDGSRFSLRAHRGGDWSDVLSGMWASIRLAGPPDFGSSVLGFRVASIFEAIELSGDYDGSGVVEQADLDLVLLNWGNVTPPIPSSWINDMPSGAIDQEELDRVLLNWGSTATGSLATSAVPEPSGIVLALLALSVVCVMADFRPSTRRVLHPLSTSSRSSSPREASRTKRSRF